MSNRCLLHAVTYALIALPAAARAQPPAAPLTFWGALGEETSGTLAAAWVGDDRLLLAGFDPVVRSYRVSQGSGAPRKPRLADCFLDGSRHLTLSERAASVLALAVDRGKSRVLAGGSDYRARVWNLQPELRLEEAGNLRFHRLAIDAHGDWLAALCKDASAGPGAQDVIQVWRLTDSPPTKLAPFPVSNATALLGTSKATSWR